MSKVYQGKPHTIPELKETIQCEIAAMQVIMLTNVTRYFTDRLQEAINVEGRHLLGIVFHNYLSFVLPKKLPIFVYKLSFILFEYLQN